jgi:hypothetical protein
MSDNEEVGFRPLLDAVIVPLACCTESSHSSISPDGGGVDSAEEKLSSLSSRTGAGSTRKKCQ